MRQAELDVGRQTDLIFMPEIDLPPEYSQHLARQGFELGRVLGQGLSGSVFAAEQLSLGRPVAVKFFDSAFVRGDEAMRKRFFREARILAKFQHPGIPYILTEGEIAAAHGPTPYFVMEFVAGETLDARLRNNGSMAPDTAIEIASQILDALAYSHERHIVHRDVKPSNIMIDQRQRCFLIDFSIGVNLNDEQGFTRATESGMALGSTQYMAPEQLRSAKDIDLRADLYSIGVVLFEMLTGSTDRTNIPKVLGQASHGLVQTIERACASRPEERFMSAEEFLRALGGTRRAMPPSLQPALAICANTKCRDANWSSNGYYRGPKIIEESTDSYCTSCGELLKYRCDSCGASVTSTPHCGACGQSIFEIPTCRVCGSYLTREFMDKDTTKGCRKCMAKQQSRTTSAKSDFDDDIPF